MLRLLMKTRKTGRVRWTAPFALLMKTRKTGRVRWTAPFALLMFASLTSIASAQSLVLDSPLDYQVFQRQSRDSGEIAIAGRTAADHVEARTESRLGGKSEWVSAPVNPQFHVFHFALSAPAGGFYSVQVRAAGIKPGIVEQVAVEHVGVGEVFVIAGESNATNYGEVRTRTRSGLVSAFSGKFWTIADDPQPGVQDNSSHGSFIPAFGDAMYERFRVPIGVACVGHGSTSVRQWLPKGVRYINQPTMPRFSIPADGIWESDGRPFDGMMQRIGQLGPKGFRAMLWHQGESDANQRQGHEITSGDYRRLLTHIIKRSRQQAGWDFPWFVAQATYHSPDETGSTDIRNSQEPLWSDTLILRGPDTDTLTGLNRQNNGQGVHFSEQGLAAHGKLWAKIVGDYLARELDKT